MYNHKTILTLYCFLLSFLRGFPQGDKLVFYPVNNPTLQQYSIRSLTTDREGKLWLSTDKGLLCYDGNDVRVFQHRDKDPFSISSDDVWRTYPDPNGNLFVLNSFHEKNLNYLDVKTGKFTPLNIIHKAEDFRIMATPIAYSDLLVEDDESVWLAAYFIGFAQYNMKTQKTESYYFKGEFSGKNTVYTIRQDYADKNLLWLGTEDGIYSFNKITKELKRNFRCSNALDSSVTDLQVTKMDLINRDTIWFAVPGKGLGCYEIKSGFYTMYPFLNKSKNQKPTNIDIIKMQHRNKDDYYIATEKHLPGIFNTGSRYYDFTATRSQDLSTALLNDFLVDSSGNFWCVLYNRLYVAHPANNKFSTININDTSENSQTVNFFKNIVWDSKKECYYAAFEKSKEIFVIDRNFHIAKSIPLQQQNQSVETSIYDLGIDPQGRLWVCGNSLYVYDDASRNLVISNKIFPKLRFYKQRFQNLVFRSDHMYLQPSDQNCRVIYRVNLKQMDYDSIPLPDEMVKDNSGIYQPDRRLDFLILDKEERNSYWGYNRHSLFGYIDGIIQYNLETRKAKRISHAPTIYPQNTNHIFPYALDDSDRLWIGGVDDFTIYEAGNCNLIGRAAAVPATFSGSMCNAEGKGIIGSLYPNCVLLNDYKNNKKYKLTLNDGLVSYMNTGIAFVNNYLFVGTANYIQYISLAAVIGKPNPNRKCYLSSVQLFNQIYIKDTLPQYLHILNLTHDKNFITLTFSSVEFEQAERLEYRYKLNGVDKDWVYVSALNPVISYNDLKPDNYIFYAEVKNDDGNWSNDGVNLLINIVPAWWQTVWFKISFVLAAILAIYMLILWRIRAVRRQEQLKSKYEKEMLELEAKALRAQMNPHFIFNCMNSIKSLIQQSEQDKAVVYLTTFSKLIRTIFQNSDKREITLYDEIETCRLYTQLESMRFGNKFIYRFNIDETLDLKYFRVPALIIQPFIENSIWHGIMPKEDGGIVTVTVGRTASGIHCTIDDDGIGREVSNQNRYNDESSAHQSKGIHLTQTRLDFDNLLNDRNANVEIIDKKDEGGKPNGTTVTLTFNED